MALTRIRSDQITDGQVKSADLDPNISLPIGAGFSDNSISGDKIDGGTISNFASTGIDDNATTTALTIDSNGHVTLTGELRGPASFVIDPAAVGDDTGTVVIKGNLQVDGLTTTINSTTLTIDDKNIVLASGAADSAAADGAGITVDGAGATINYVHSGTKWQANKAFDITANTASTSTTTGALTVAGGVGIAGALNVGGNAAFNGVTVAQSTGAGYVNIGTAADRTQYQYINFGGGVGGTDYAWQIGRSPTAGIVADGFYVYDIKGNATRLAILGNGNVGIGTTSPATQLDLAASNTGITTGTPLNTLRFTDTDTTSAAGQPMGRIEWYSADTDTAGVKAYIQAQSTDGSPDSDMVFATNHVNGGGTAERMRIQYDGKLLLGTATSRVVGQIIGGFQLSGDVDRSSISLSEYVNDGNAPRLSFGKSRGTSDGSYTIVQSGDELGVISFSGADGTDLASRGAEIKAAVDGTPGSNSMPGRLMFSTTADGAVVPTERMRINSAGVVSVSGTTVSTTTTTGALTVAGGVGIAGALNVGGNVNTVSGALQINGTNIVDSSRNASFATMAASSYIAVGSIVANDPGATYYSYNNRIGGNVAVVGNLDVYNGVVATNDQSKYEYTASVYPKVKPTLSLDFANSESVDKRITFTRSTNATYYDANGILRTAYADQPRIDFDPATGECKGLLIEEQRTNISRSTLNYSILQYVNCFGIPNATVAPDGTHTALLVQSVPSPTSVTCVFINALSSVSAGQVYTCSIYLKAGPNPDQIAWAIYDGPTSVNYGSTNIFWSNGVPTATNNAVVTSVGNGWYRISVLATVPAGKTDMLALLYPSAPGAGNKNVYCWGSQFELGTFATSHVPTTLTFTSRASSATYFDSTGVLRIAGTNQPRYGYGYDTTSGKWVSQGLVLEAAATNLYSESTGLLTSLAGATASASNVLSPDGVSYAQRVQVSTNYVYKYFPSILGGGATHTWSFFVKPVNNLFRFANGGTPGSFSYYFDFTPTIPTASFGGDGFTNLGYTTTRIGNSGWWRVTCTVNGTGTPGYMEAQWSYGGTGTADFYLWGIQIETGFVATSYIPTFGSTVTRAADVSSSAATTRVADVAKITGDAFSNFYRMDESTIYAEASSAKLDDTNSESIIAFDPGQNFASMHLYNSGLGGGNSGAFGLYSFGLSNNTTYKFATTFKYMDYATVWGGGSVVTNTSSTEPVTNSATQMFIGSSGVQGFLNGHIKKLAYYNRRLPNAQLQAITE